MAVINFDVLIIILMTANIFKAEKDSLSFLGLMSSMFARFDAQIQSPTKEPTHTKGLNIHALIVDNVSGQVLGMQQNTIHKFNNPLLHAEQLTLQEAINEKNKISPRDPSTTSVEDYYRNLLFNDPQSYDALNSGCSIYTTLEPCPFCTSALLVSRMKRIVFITPDSAYGSSYYNTWATYYKKYDIHYEQMDINSINSPLVQKSKMFLTDLLQKIKGMTVPGTLFFDTLQADLKIIYDYFVSVKDSDLVSTGSELARNAKLLSDLQSRSEPMPG